MSSRSISSWVALTWDNESGGIWTKVLEQLTENVESKQATLAQPVVGKTNDTEQDSQDDETPELDKLSTNDVHGGDRQPVTWDTSGTDQDQVTCSLVVQRLVNVG